MHDGKTVNGPKTIGQGGWDLPSRIGKMRLKVYDAVFDAHMRFYYLANGEEEITDQGKDILSGQFLTMDPGDKGAPNGAEMWLCVVLSIGSGGAQGKDKVAKERFIYRKGGPLTVYYNIRGSIAQNHLSLDSVK